MFQTFDHTADIGLRIAAESLPELFAEAARGLMSLLVEDFDEIRPLDSETIELVGTEIDYLLFDWLNELLFQFETRGRLFCEFALQISETGLKATLRGETCDRLRHQLAHEVKAITYHGLTVEQVGQHWRAELILDI